MAKILKETTIRNPLSNEYICSVVMDLDMETKEGFCIEFYGDDTSESTSFGLGLEAEDRCNQLYNALSNCCKESAQICNYDIDRFWELLNKEFESGWILTDENGIQDYNESSINKLETFICKWTN